VVTLHLTVNNSTTGDTTATACNSFSWYGTTYTVSGTPTHTFATAAGCDSVVTLHLTIDQSPTTADAGSDQAVTGSTATLAGNTPTVGTGLWTLFSGTGTITTPGSPTSGVTGLGVGANVFHWTISNGTCPASFDDVTIVRDGDTVKFRTAKYEDWATATDIKGKYKSVKRKNDKVVLKFNFVAPRNGINGFILDFGMLTTGEVTEGHDKLVLVGAPFTAMKKVTFTGLAIDSLDTFQVDAIGAKGKKAKVKVTWTRLTKPTTVKQTIVDYLNNDPQLPMPNLHNVGEELFGSNQASAFPTGLLIGIPEGTKLAKSVMHLKYKDAQKSMLKVANGAPVLHDDSISCLEKFPVSNKLIDKQLKALPPDKFSNKLFAELLTLKLNVAASAYNKFPNGLGELTYNDLSDPSNPFNEQIITDIILKADSMISCRQVKSKTVTPTNADLYDVLHKINGSFEDGTVDTIGFAVKTVMTGIKRISDVPWLERTPGIVPRSFIAQPIVTPTTPEEFKLDQNYPNPFNPTTNIQFELPNPAVVTLKVYNMLGQEVATLLDRQEMEDGVQEVEFNASSFASGVYFYRMTAEQIANEDDGIEASTFVTAKKMLLLK
jgi:hypothetical protein